MANFPFVHQVTRTPIQCKCSVKSSNYLTLKKKNASCSRSNGGSQQLNGYFKHWITYILPGLQVPPLMGVTPTISINKVFGH